MRSYLLAVGTVVGWSLCPHLGTAQALVQTLAGSGAAGLVDGAASTAQFNNPYGVTQDALGNTYVADAFNHAIRKISPGGLVTTIGGTGSFGYADAATGTLAAFNDPKKLFRTRPGTCTWPIPATAASAKYS